MKTFLSTALIALIWLGAVAKQNIIRDVPNPWEDDYEAIAAVDNSAYWGTYNVHDPACRKVGDYYYMYSTDAIYFSASMRQAMNQRMKNGEFASIPQGFLQMRRSRDLINWEFMGWAFDAIPSEPLQWVHDNNEGRGGTNIWAPYMVPAPNGKEYRLYYCVSAFGKKTSMISLATAPTPLGPWTHQGSVVKTNASSIMNAIDPTVSDVVDGQQWMIYGSYFGGLFCVELDPESGFVKNPGDQGHLVSRRANYKKDNLEAPELIFSPQHNKYFLFASYDPLVTTYNVRVGRGDAPQGPFYDFNGKVLADTTNNMPIITAPYAFKGHEGWGGVGHCGVFDDNEGNWYICHQGRLAPNLEMLNLHIRQLFFTEDGWPVVSPERYAGTEPRTFIDSDLVGTWEIIKLCQPDVVRDTAAGQVLPGEGSMLPGEWNHSYLVSLDVDGKTGEVEGLWSFDSRSQLLTIKNEMETLSNLIIFAGHDWERAQDTILFTGLDNEGRAVWGKLVNN